MRYMGTKRHLTAQIMELCGKSRDGPLLDLFAGTCSVGRALSPQRNVWCNDAQFFASQLATAIFTSVSLPPNADSIASSWAMPIAAEEIALSEGHVGLAKAESDAVRGQDLRAAQRIFEKCNAAAQELSRERLEPPQALLTALYGGTYFSISQALEMDAIRSVISRCSRSGEIDQDEERWLLLAMCEAADRIANTTGHFAQSLFPKDSNFSRYSRQRDRSFRYEWLASLKRLMPIGGRNWRTKNMAFRGDALECLENLKSNSVRPAIVYADPPYTKDQYSRYYSVLETIMLGDFPELTGRGLVRKDGFKSQFSQTSSVEGSLISLIEGAMNLDADLIISYPSNGLCGNAEELVVETSRIACGRLPEIAEVQHIHSSLGASKGKAKAAVIEKLYRIAA